VTTLNELPFEEIWFVDFEFVSRHGERPDPVCLGARELCSGQTFRLWRDQMGDRPPYRTDASSLFVNFVANAECACHLALGWPLPAKVLDLSPLFRCVVNGRLVPQGKGLLGALAHYRVDAIDATYKDKIRKRIIKGWPFTAQEQAEILKYVMGDVDPLPELLAKLMLEPEFDLGVALHWGEFAAVSALMEHRGIPLDMEIIPQLQDKRAWSFVRDSVVPKIDAQYGVYIKDRAGDWHFNIEKFEALCARLGIDWPRHDTGKLDLRRKTFESMSKAYPEMESLRQLRHARDKMRRIKLAVGRDGRNRTVLWPFASKTSRTQPKAAQWIFSPAVWLRFTIKPGPGRAVAYIDWSSMEFQVAAVLSGSKPMIELYATGSPYIEFAKRFDVVPPSATKKTRPEVHDTYKVVLLGAQYQMQHATLAKRLGISSFAAYEMLNQHRGLFNQYWAWSEDWIARALDTGLIRTPMASEGRRCGPKCSRSWSNTSIAKRSSPVQLHVRRSAKDPFVQVPLWWIEAAAKATRDPAVLVLIELLRRSWRTRRTTFPLPNGRLRELGVSREIKRRVLRNLERARLITVERPPRKAPLVTLLLLSRLRATHTHCLRTTHELSTHDTYGPILIFSVFLPALIDMMAPRRGAAT
jgi:DNA polymerase I